MRPELQAKLIQHLNQKKGDQGFTLVELLVVIVIIGILTAIALPSFLNQTAKAKQSEAKQNVSTFIKAQQSYRTEKPRFAPTFNDLALGNLQDTATPGTATTNVYNYTLGSAAGGIDDVGIGAQSKDTAVRSYMGRTDVASVGATTQIQWTSTICENNDPSNTVVSGMTSTAAGSGAGCPAGSTAVK